MEMLGSRRFVLAMTSIIILGSLGWFKQMDIGIHIATIVVGIAASNAYQKKDKK